jgi:filamentous hemagglutinin family protein
MNATNHHRLYSSGLRHSAGFLLACALATMPLMIPIHTLAQVAPITSSGLNTEISDPIAVGENTQFNITGGIRPGGETNLFLSFGKFGVPLNNIANFLNGASFDLDGTLLTPGLPTINILARVTGSNGNDPSLSGIYGTIQTTGFENANLFLMNPAGFLFGPNATLNVSGSVTITTANNLRMNGDALFNAIPGPVDTLLSAAPVAAFGFLGSIPGTIIVQGSNLSQPGNAVNLIGGDIIIAPADVEPGTVQTAHITAHGGQINLVSVASTGDVLASSFQPTSGMSLGSINLGPGTLVDVSGDAAGAIRIRGGSLVMDNATISADSADADGALVAIDVDVGGDLVITSNSAPAFTARTTGAGDAGDIHLASGNLTATSLPNGSSFSFIESYTLGSGEAGSIILTTGELDVSTDPFSIPIFFIDSGTGGEGKGGHVTINAAGAHFSNTGMNTGDSFLGGSGSAGNISIKSDTTLTIETSTFAGDSINSRGGDMTLEAREIALSINSFLDVLSLEGESAIHITADRLTVDDASAILNQTALGLGGGITITAKSVEVTNSSLILSQTFGDGDAGNIHVTATDHLTVTDDPQLGSNPSGFYTNSLGNAGLGTHGNAGAIEITTPHLTLSGGARINSTTQSSGQGGDVTITAHDVTLFGQRTLEVDSELFGLGGTKATGIYTRTVGSEFCAGSCGDAGHVTIDTGSLALSGGAVIDSGTTNNGQGGNVSVNATDRVLISGTISDGTPGGVFSRTVGMAPDSGDGGNIALTAGQSVTISDGASVSASSTGTGTAGNITINAAGNFESSSGTVSTTATQAQGGDINITAGQDIRITNNASVSASSTGAGNAGNITAIAGNDFIMQNSSVTTQATQASGGNIKIGAADQILIRNSLISASVMGGGGSGGNISIDPTAVILQNSQILARAVLGNGGNITITTPLFLSDQSSLVSASSQFGLNGTVTIQSPTSNLSGSLGPLTSKPSQPQSLVTQRCAALVNGQASSFVVAGREQLPSDPGSWLTSPIALAGIDADPFRDGTVAESASHFAPRTSGLLANDRVSLRRLTPARFLMANFADSEATGCHS